MYVTHTHLLLITCTVTGVWRELSTTVPYYLVIKPVWLGQYIFLYREEPPRPTRGCLLHLEPTNPQPDSRHQALVRPLLLTLANLEMK